ncbi:MAG: class I SAM-dependent methyltransferase [Pseudonocardiales bacterium]|nr:class I SAM-dependent methyltransferase [Pseudonocardiales bacterium]
MIEAQADARTQRPSAAEVTVRGDLERLFHGSPIEGHDRLEQLELYLRPQLLAHIFALSELYRKILDVHGVVLDLGTRYGRNMVTFSSLRRYYEPFNHFRRIVGFDTFSGFPESSISATDTKDGQDGSLASHGMFGVPAGYRAHLSELMRVHEQDSPLSHIVRHEIREGDIETELPRYFAENPETIVALAYFDLDLYQPTKVALEQILPHTTKGTILALDEPTHPMYPGETVAFKEVLDLRRYPLHRDPHQPQPAYVVL